MLSSDKIIDLLARGYAISKTGILDNVFNPQFDKKHSKIHNWRKYVDRLFIENWNSLPVEVKAAIFCAAYHHAINEEWD